MTVKDYLETIEKKIRPQAEITLRENVIKLVIKTDRAAERVKRWIQVNSDRIHAVQGIDGHRLPLRVSIALKQTESPTLSRLKLINALDFN